MVPPVCSKLLSKGRNEGEEQGCYGVDGELSGSNCRVDRLKVSSEGSSLIFFLSFNRNGYLKLIYY